MRTILFASNKAMRTILFANNKGGVGRTPAAYYTALRLAQNGHTVTIVDMDGQCNLTDMILPGDESQPSIVDVLTNRCGCDDAITPAMLTSGESLQLIRATPDLYDLEIELSSGLGVMRLGNALRQADSLGDVVIIDTPPNLGSLTLSAVIAVGMMGGWVVVPTRPDANSVGGIRAIEAKIDEANQIPGCRPVLLGTIATQVRHTNTHDKWLANLRGANYPPLLGETPLRSGELADYELRKHYSPIADTIWQMMGGDYP